MTFAVKTQALTSYAGVLGAGGHSIDLSKSFKVTAHGYVQSYTPVPYDKYDLFSAIYENNKKVVTALEQAMKDIGELYSASATNLDTSAKKYLKLDDAAAEKLDAAFTTTTKAVVPDASISTSSGLVDPDSDLAGVPSTSAPVPDMVQWIIDKAGWLSISGNGLKIASLFGVDPVGDLTKAVAGDYGELAQAGHAVKALSTFEKSAASTMLAGWGAVQSDWTGNAADAAHTYFTNFANALVAHADKLDTLGDKYALLVQACAEAATALGTLLSTVVDRLLILIAEIAAAGCLASVPGINVIIALVGAYQVFITREAIAKFIQVTTNVLYGIDGLLAAVTGIAGVLTDGDIASDFPAKPYSNASLPA